MSAWAGLLVGLAVAQGLAPAAPASAAVTSVVVVDGDLIVQASVGAANQLLAWVRDGRLHVVDVVPLVARTNCELVAETEAACPMSAVRSLSFQLGDGHDSAGFHVPVPVRGSGGPGNDRLTGGGAGNTLSGGAGDDIINGSVGADTLHGGAGADVLYGMEGDDYLAGGEQGDSLFGGPGEDTLDEPASGENSLDGGTGDDMIIGRPNMRDMAVYRDRSADVGANLSSTAYDGESVDLPAGHAGELDKNGTLVERDVLVGVHDISTGDGDDILIGPGGDPIMNSGAGNDLCDPNGNDGVVLTPCR